MLTIIRGRSFEVIQECRDALDGPLSDLSNIVSVKSQIREKTALDGGEHKLVADVTVALSGLTNSTVTISLTKAQTAALETGEYQIDIVGTTSGGKQESIMDPEAICVVNRPTIL